MRFRKKDLLDSVNEVKIMSDLIANRAMKSGGKNTHLSENPKKFEFLTQCARRVCDFTIKKFLHKNLFSAKSGTMNGERVE